MKDVTDQMKVDKKGYNYRICCLYSLAVVMPYLTKEQINALIIPALVASSKDDIPNVKFCVSKIIAKYRNYID